MKTEAEKIRDFKVIGCYNCESSTFDSYQIVCTCSVKGVVHPMGCCELFKEKRRKNNGDALSRRKDTPYQTEDKKGKEEKF